MKKILNTLIITVLIIGSLGGIVNASGTKNVKVGDTVKVTISLGKSVTSAALEGITWDTSLLEYVSNDTGKKLNGGKLGFFGDEERSNVTLTFKAKAEGTAKVKANITEIGPDSVNKTDTTTITIKGDETKPTPTPTPAKPTPTPTTKPTSTTKPTPTKTNKKDTTKTETKVEETTENIEEQEKEKEEEIIEVAPNELIKLDDENAMKFVDDSSKVMIKAIKGALDENIKLQVEKVSEENEIYTKIEDILKNVKGNKSIFDINLLKDNVKIQPNGYVTVFIPIPDEYNKELLEIYYVNTDNGNYEPLQGEIQGEYYTFTTNHFSTYVLVEKPEPKTFAQSVEEIFTNLTILYSIIAVLILIIVIETIVIVNLKKKSKRSK